MKKYLVSILFMGVMFLTGSPAAQAHVNFSFGFGIAPPVIIAPAPAYPYPYAYPRYYYPAYPPYHHYYPRFYYRRHYPMRRWGYWRRDWDGHGRFFRR